MPKAMWNGAVVAESDETTVVEGNHYFPPNAINPEYFRKSDHRTMCVWKGSASYYDLIVDGEVNERAAWYYSEPMRAAERLKDHVAFWHGVAIED